MSIQFREDEYWRGVRSSRWVSTTGQRDWSERQARDKKLERWVRETGQRDRSEGDNKEPVRQMGKKNRSERPAR